MDSETGEGISDKETGELINPKINLETGEYEYFYKSEITTEKSTGFKIPSNLIDRNIRKEVIDESDQYLETKLVFSGMRPNSPIFLFFVPTITLFIPAFVIVLIAVEMILHSWAHKKNRVLSKDNINNIYYQSPYHIVAREFCPTCRFEWTNTKITRIQDKRTRRLFIKYGLDYVKRVV